MKKKQSKKTDAIDNTLIDESVEYITQHKQKIDSNQLKIGKKVFEVIFHGDSELMSSTDPFKRMSFSELCRRLKGEVSRTFLQNATRAAAQEIVLKEHGVETDKLKYAHKVALLREHDVERKVELANEAIAKPYTVKDLINNIKEDSSESEEEDEEEEKEDEAVADDEDNEDGENMNEEDGSQILLTTIRTIRESLKTSSPNLVALNSIDVLEVCCKNLPSIKYKKRLALYRENKILLKQLSNYVNGCQWLKDQLNETAKENGEQNTWKVDAWKKQEKKKKKRTEDESK